MKFEEEYMDVLQNIEFAIITVYRKHQDLLDYDVMDAIESLINLYKAEEVNREPKPIRLSDKAHLVFDSAKAMCDVRLGKEKFITKDGKTLDIPTITIGEIINCLKRIKKSVNTWNERNGRQGYLKFVDQYIK